MSKLSSNKHCARERGISIIEMTLLAGIVTLISTLTVYHAVSSTRLYNLRAEAEEIASGLRLARMRAIALDKEVRVTFAGGTWGISDPSLTDNETRRRPLPENRLTSSASELPIIVFSKKGTVSFEVADGNSVAPELTLILTDPRGEAMRIRINQNGLTEVASAHP